jgi:hypothetical protein
MNDIEPCSNARLNSVCLPKHDLINVGWAEIVGPLAAGSKVAFFAIAHARGLLIDLMLC